MINDPNTQQAPANQEAIAEQATRESANQEATQAEATEDAEEGSTEG